MAENETKSTQTTTVVETKNEEVTLVNVRYPLVLMFAEYLGYVSPLLDWAEKLCMGTEIPSYQRKVLMVDAKSIMSQILNDFSRDEVVDLYNSYYEVVLYDYDEALEKLEKTRTDDLPF